MLRAFTPWVSCLCGMGGVLECHVYHQCFVQARYLLCGVRGWWGGGVLPARLYLCCCAFEQPALALAWQVGAGTSGNKPGVTGGGSSSEPSGVTATLVDVSYHPLVRNAALAVLRSLALQPALLAHSITSATPATTEEGGGA